MSLQPNKSPEQIEAMRQGGRILGSILHDLKQFVKVGMTGLEVDQWVEQQILKHGAIVTYKDPAAGVDYPASICISVNENIVHGLPNEIPFQKGDVVKFDLVITYNGMMVDSAFTMVVGEEPTGVKKILLSQTEKALYAGIEQVKAGAKVGDISAAIEKVAVKAKLGVVKELVGHGVGQEMHMEPEVPNYGRRGTGPVLSVGNTIAIEPMFSLGKPAIRVSDDGWTIAMRDGSLSAHFEHTVLVTESGCEILTKQQ
ncbi:MAG: type I methionyl aminopeptidase [Candidatus Saccharibacteria bacterium]|nr:type I methionyl aminopeptidase [Candidatus Saccharibacteria bacterium]